MKFVVKCGKCGSIFQNDLGKVDDGTVEFDFFEQQIRYICRNKECQHDNSMDIANWQKKQKHSPLPRIGISH